MIKFVRIPTKFEVEKSNRKETRTNSLLLIATIAMIIGGTLIECSGYF